MIQGDVSKSDILFAAAVLAVLLPLLLVAGRLLSRFRNRRFAKAWAPLEPVLSKAKITGDGGGAATSWLSGTYRDADVYASMTPHVARASGSRINANRFSVGMQELPGTQDRSLEWSTGIPLISPAGWAFRSADSGLDLRLDHAGVVARIEPFGQASLRYQARERTLVWTANIDPYVVLPPDQFRRVLDALLEVAAVNNSVNVVRGD